MFSSIFKAIRSLSISLFWGAAIGLCAIPIFFVAMLMLTFYFFYATIVVGIVGFALAYFFNWMEMHDPFGGVIIITLYFINAVLCLALSGVPVIPPESKPRHIRELGEIIQSKGATGIVYMNLAVMFAASVAVSHGLFHWMQRV